MPVFPAVFPAPLGPDASSPAIGAIYDVGIAGRGFFLDLEPDKPYRRSVQPIRTQKVDTGEEQGEQSLGDAWWRRIFNDFSGGAGQRWYDRKTSDRRRFKESKGIDVFSLAPEVTLLHSTAEIRSSANTNLYLQRADSGGVQYLYASDGNALVRSSDPYVAVPTFTTITGGPAAAPTGLTSSGEYVYAGYAANGIYRSAVSGTTTASWSAQNATLVRWAKQRIMAANANIIYELSSAGTATARYTHWNPGWVWTDFAEIGGAILACGYVGEKGTVFRSTIATDGTLGTFVDAIDGGLPDGEVPQAMVGYAGLLILATNKGVRLCSHDSDGNLTYGPKIPTDMNLDVTALEPEDVYCWFSWANYDSSSTGLGRIDLRTFTATLRPAYASDLMATSQGVIRSIATVSSKRIFSVSADGIFAEQTAYVTSGDLVTSRVAYGIGHTKLAKLLVMNQVPGTGSITPAIADASDSFSILSTCADSTCEITVNSVRSEAHSLRFTLTAGGATAPIFRDATLKALPVLKPNRTFTLPILLFDVVERRGQLVGYPGKALEDLEYIDELINDGNSVTLEDLTSNLNGMGARSFTCEFVQTELMITRTDDYSDGFGGTYYVVLRETE